MNELTSPKDLAGLVVVREPLIDLYHGVRIGVGCSSTVGVRAVGTSAHRLRVRSWGSSAHAHVGCACNPARSLGQEPKRASFGWVTMPPWKLTKSPPTASRGFILAIASTL